MLDTDALAKHYKYLTDGELLSLRSEGGLSEEAVPVLADELKRRNLKDGDRRRYAVPERIKLREEVREKGFRFRGPGLLFFRRTYLNETDKEANIQVRTKWFALGGIPLLPIASYRFKCTGDRGKWFEDDTGQRVVDRIPLNWKQVLNGIADDAQHDRIFVTGKQWPMIFEIRYCLDAENEPKRASPTDHRVLNQAKRLFPDLLFTPKAAEPVNLRLAAKPGQLALGVVAMALLSRDHRLCDG